MLAYDQFLDGKRHSVVDSGFDVGELSPVLYDFQDAIVKWALKKGRAAIFSDCGTGKTIDQLEWARHVHIHTGRDILIVAPLAVSEQTKREGVKLGVDVNKCQSQADIKPGINITNYERLVDKDGNYKFDQDTFAGIVLDESSILKSYSGKYRKALTEFAFGINYRLCCTATPAPNDLIEITNHAEFLGVLKGKEAIALFFKQDGNTTNQWALKGHAAKDFWEWMAGWAIAVRTPSDIGFDDGRFILPKLNVTNVELVQQDGANGFLFPMPANGLKEQRDNRRATLDQRVAEVVRLVENEPDEPWLVWCELNDESAAVKKAIGAVEVKGSDSIGHKERALLGFASGDVNRLVTKPKIAGWGMNWQRCARVIFFGVDHSFEGYYQALRRVWRFGQEREVMCYRIVADTDGPILANIQRKEKLADRMMDQIITHMRGIQMDQIKQRTPYQEDKAEGDNWTMFQGDCVDRIKEIEDETVGLSVFSPPFPGMYAYTDSEHDLGNAKSKDELIDHFKYLIPGMLRVTMPGRNCCIHLSQQVAMKSRNGFMGLIDFRGGVIQAMTDGGWDYHGEVTIDKNPQVEAVRNKTRGLLFKSLATDSSVMRMGTADYLLQFAKPGDNAEPIRAGLSSKYNPDGQGWITEQEWIEWAAPVWYRHIAGKPGGIRETDVLNVRQAKDDKDERHLCPLQLGVIERAVKLWSAPGDLVLSPFAGIGSEGYESLRHGRRFVGIELKRSYFDVAVRNLQSASVQQDSLLAMMEAK